MTKDQLLRMAQECAPTPWPGQFVTEQHMAFLEKFYARAISSVKSREDAARFVRRQFGSRYECSREKGGQHHYGRQELRELLDYIYGPPQGAEEEIPKPSLGNFMDEANSTL